MLIVCRQDLHSEVTAGGTVQLLQVVRAVPRATQGFVRFAAEPVLRTRDEFDCNHRPTVGPFSPPLPAGTGRGELLAPGQSLVRVKGVCIATLAGTNSACSEGVRTLDNRAVAFFTKRPFVKINGSFALTGER